MKVHFVVLEPESKRGTYHVPLPILVGRGNEAKFRIQQDRISRKHCEVIDRDGDVYVRDLGSTNGTFLDGEQIEVGKDMPVPPGSVLKIGTIEIRIDYEGTGRHTRATFVEDVAREAGADAETGIGSMLDAPPMLEPEAADALPEADALAEADALPEAEPLQPAEPAAPDFAETTKAPEPDALGDLPEAEPVADAFSGLAEAEPQASEGGSFDFLGSEPAADASDDDKLGDFFKGLN